MLDLSTNKKVSEFVLKETAIRVPNSSTYLSLSPEGYPEDGDINVTINKNRKIAGKDMLRAAQLALDSGCGNCQEMAYAGALILREAGYKGKVSIGGYGINHQFLIIGNNEMIIDPWANKAFEYSEWENNINAYGGSIKEGILKGRLLSPNYYELEDEKPEIADENILEIQKVIDTKRWPELLVTDQFISGGKDGVNASNLQKLS
ncbi:hypothetical protein L3V82_05105 [Thiotrichales bacterium 19S3-7]|nr:hypothetical protein [Thiotrichales bacterium 19S3-7]MCF6801470.1 hypothetical protein [Thiotrichales bacterium 19S3-11]